MPVTDAMVRAAREGHVVPSAPTARDAPAHDRTLSNPPLAGTGPLWLAAPLAHTGSAVCRTRPRTAVQVERTRAARDSCPASAGDSSVVRRRLVSPRQRNPVTLRVPLSVTRAPSQSPRQCSVHAHRSRCRPTTEDQPQTPSITAIMSCQPAAGLNGPQWAAAPVAPLV